MEIPTKFIVLQICSSHFKLPENYVKYFESSMKLWPYVFQCERLIFQNRVTYWEKTLYACTGQLLAWALT